MVGLVLGGCGDNSSHASYNVTIKNTTYAQPFSPMAAILHSTEKVIFQVGAEASVELESLAEGGDNTPLIETMQSDVHVSDVVSGSGLILPAHSASLSIEGEQGNCLTLAGMLVNTNDAFVGAHCIDLSALAKGEHLHIGLVAYDAGTELNSESAATIPGPAGGGEGFNAARDDNNIVTVHHGVITQDEGLSSSALTQEHRWDNPVAMVMIERTR